MQLHDLMAKLFELRQVAADQAKDGLSGSGAMARALTAYEWLGDNIEAFVDSLDPEMTEGPASQTEGMGGDADGWLYFNPDAGIEWSPNHPVESGEVHDAENVRAATATALRIELVSAWQALADEVAAGKNAGAILTPPETAEAVPVGVRWRLKADFNGQWGPGPWVIGDRSPTVHGDTIESEFLYAHPAPATDDRERLVEALRRSAQGWANVIELGLLPAQHVATAQELHDDARAVLATEASR